MPTPHLPFPQLDIGVPQYPTPHVQGGGYVILLEKVSTETAKYQPLDPQQNPIYRGIDANKYPTLFLLKQDMSETGQFVTRYWTNSRDINWQDTWNYGIKYLGEEKAYPIYVREYTLPRLGYAPDALGSTCQSVLGIKLLDGGAAYTSKPTIALSNTDATADCNVANGQVTNVWLTSPGTTVSGSVGVTFSGGGATTQAMANAFIQPQASVLVKEVMQPMGEGDPLASLFVKVQKIYQTLPGPWISSIQIDADSVPITVQKRLNLTSAAKVNCGESILITYSGSPATTATVLPGDEWPTAPAGKFITGITWQETTMQGEESDFVAEEIFKSRSLIGCPPIISTKVDEELNVTITIFKQKMALLQIISSAIVIGSDPPTDPPSYIAIEVVNQQAETSLMGWQVTEHIPASPFTVDSPVKGLDTTTYAWPDLLDNSLTTGCDFYGQYTASYPLVIAEPLFYSQRKADTVPVRTNKWFVINPSYPGDPPFDEVIPSNDYCYWYNKTYTGVIHNDHAVWTPGSATITIPKSTPSFTEYINDWVGNWKVIRAKCIASKYALLWQYETESIQMIAPIIGAAAVATTPGATVSGHGVEAVVTLKGSVNPGNDAGGTSVCFWAWQGVASLVHYTSAMPGLYYGNITIQLTTTLTGLNTGMYSYAALAQASTGVMVYGQIYTFEITS